jgi:FkbM family methyltransferase
MISFCKYVLKEGGSVHPLFVPGHDSGVTGLMNPSVHVDNGRIFVNLRSVNYVLYHAENRKFPNRYGPLCHLQPESTNILKTENYFTELDHQYQIKMISKVDTTSLDNPNPQWLFHGLEDARVVKWDNNLYLCGVRRDTTNNGEGRMELSQISWNGRVMKEHRRYRVPSPDDSYCEKNWMPILDKPFHFVRWANPVHIVKYDIYSGRLVTIFKGNDTLDLPFELRGGSQVISIGDYYICATHEVQFTPDEQGRKDGIYNHRFLVYDKNWNFVNYTPPFKLLGAKIEFITGMCKNGDDILISFGFQDNASFLIRINQKSFLKFFLDWGDNESYVAEMICEEVFINGVYEKFKEVKQGDVVFDIGANIGAFTRSIVDKNPKHVYCVEPSDNMVLALRNNLSNYPVTIISKAVSDTNGTQEVTEGIHIYHNSSNQFKTITFKDLVSGIDRIDFMKIDCEGGEYSVFTENNLDYIKNNVKHIAGEWHLWGVPDAVNNFKKFRDLYLTGSNFRVFDRWDNEVTHKVWSDIYIEDFSNTYTHGAQLMIYIDN